MSLTTILFTEYRRRVLGLLLLHPEHDYHLREIARLTGTVPGTLGRELTKLTEAGVLVKKRVGNQLHYSANRNCPIFDELASILRKTSGLADVLADALLSLADRIHCAFVFGSMASGKAGSHSDIDLMVIGNAGFTDVSTALYPAQEILGREINPKVYNVQEWLALVAQQGAFVKEILTKPRVFVLGNDKDLDSLMTESGHGPR